MADIEIPPSGLVHTNLAAQIAGVAPGTIRAWKNRGHLKPAVDIDGQLFRDKQGRQLYDYMDVINTEFRLRPRARRAPVNYAA